MKKIRIWKATLKVIGSSVFIEGDSMSSAIFNSVIAFNNQNKDIDVASNIEEDDLQSVAYLMEVWVCES